MGIVRRPSVVRWLLVCLLVSYTGFSKLSTIDEADADGTSGHDASSRTTRVAVMIVGGVRNENGLQVWASIQTNVIEPLRQNYDEVDVFFCIGQSQLDSNLRENVTSAGPVGYNVQFWSYEVGSNEIYVHPQFERMRVCYDNIEDRFGGSFPRYDSIVKTRPDNLWGSPVPLPFSNQHVLTRAREVQGMSNLTYGQISWTSCEPGRCRTDLDPINPPPFNPRVHKVCGFVDDMVAVVPKLHQEAYFRGRPPLAIDTVDGAVTVDDGDTAWPVMSIVEESCSCFNYSIGRSTEALFTRLLAQLNVTVALAPFHLHLTKRKGSGIRSWEMKRRDYLEMVTCM